MTKKMTRGDKLRILAKVLANRWYETLLFTIIFGLISFLTIGLIYSAITEPKSDIQSVLIPLAIIISLVCMGSIVCLTFIFILPVRSDYRYAIQKEDIRVLVYQDLDDG